MNISKFCLQLLSGYATRLASRIAISILPIYYIAEYIFENVITELISCKYNINVI